MQEWRLWSRCLKNYDSLKMPAKCHLHAVNYAANALMADILVAGGWDSDGNALKAVERFSSMNVGRVGATSFVYENQVFVAG